MSFVELERRLYYPFARMHTSILSATGGTLDAATEKYAMIGRIQIAGRATSKTFSTSGAKIYYRTAAVTFANGGTTVDIGLQGLGASGPYAQPDGSFTIQTTLTGGGGGISANAWNTATMSSGGPASLSHGDLIAVVWDMTGRGGADTVALTAASDGIGAAYNFPICNAYISSAWQSTFTAGAGRVPNVVLEFDDGTLATIDASYPMTSSAVETYADSTNPDERGLLFQLPFGCKVDALVANIGATDANSDFTLKLYSDPTGSPSVVASVAHLAERMAGGGAGITELPIGSAVDLDPNTNYALTVLATGSTNVRLNTFTLAATGHRVLLNGGTTLAKVTRDGSSGAFTAESPAVTMPQLSVGISHIRTSGARVIGG